MHPEHPNRKTTETNRERQAETNLGFRRGLALLVLVVLMLSAAVWLMVELYPIMAKWFDV